MITWDSINVKQKVGINWQHKVEGFYLSSETEKGSYAQYYSSRCSNDRNFVCCEDEAKEKFLRFYNKFEN